MGLPDIDNIPDTGAVFTIGRSRFADNVASHFFIRRDPVIEITCGDEHSAVICQSGRLFVFGSNDWGQLGLGHKNHVSKPSCVKTLKPEKVTHVACGRAHTLICTGGQKIFSCGSDQEGQLGRGSLASGDSSSTPVMVYDCDTGGRKSVIQVATGSHHSMILTSDGAVLAWGSNLEGQLGLPGVSGLVNKPTKLQIPEAVKHISAGYYHSAFLTENGLIYVCGESESGKLGVVVNFSTQATPKQLQLPAASATIACGGHHTLVLTENGDLYCFGSNASGQLGIGVDTAEVQTPKLLPRNSLECEKVLKIACGESHSAIVTESGKVFIAGDGRHGKLGLEENENNVHELTFATRYRELFVTNVSCGGCHTILTGRRRIGSNDEFDTLQMDSVIQKRNSLPPLKVPMNRLQAETLQEKIVSGADNSKIDPDNQIESPEVVQNTVLGDIEERKTSQTPAPQTVAPRVEKPETPKKLSDYMAETASDSMEENMPSEMNRVEESKGINEELSKISQSNLKEMERTKSTASVRPSNSAKSRNAEERKNQSSIIGNTVNNSTIEKSSSSEQPVPPPKPPRQRLGSAEELITEKLPSPQSTLTSLGIPRDEVEIARNVLSAPTVPTDDIVIEKIEETIAKEAEEIVDSVTTDEQKSSLLSESKTAIDGIVGIDEKNNVEEKEAREKSTQKMKPETKPVTDNSEVVPSPAPKTGKMGKLFKNKKQVELENGTKESDTTNVKAKSKACSIL